MSTTLQDQEVLSRGNAQILGSINKEGTTINVSNGSATPVTHAPVSETTTTPVESTLEEVTTEKADDEEEEVEKLDIDEEEETEKAVDEEEAEKADDEEEEVEKLEFMDDTPEELATEKEEDAPETITLNGKTYVLAKSEPVAKGDCGCGKHKSKTIKKQKLTEVQKLRNEIKELKKSNSQAVVTPTAKPQVKVKKSVINERDESIQKGMNLSMDEKLTRMGNLRSERSKSNGYYKQ